jgi:di/tricarboxylate transporter
MTELTLDGWLSLGVTATIFITLMCTRSTPDVVFWAGVLMLWFLGILDMEEVLAGFSSPALVAVGVLYLVVAGMRETGGLQWISRRVLGVPGGPRRAQVRLMLPVGLLSAFLNNTPVVALFIPAVIEWSRRIRVPASRLLIPLSYASIFGGFCTLIGTSTNLVVFGLMEQRFGEAGFGMFDITRIGLPCALAGFAYVLAFQWLLPNRTELMETLENPREYTLEMHVPAGSSLSGKTIQEAGLRKLGGAFVAEVIRGEEILSAVQPDEILREGDRLVFVGNLPSVQHLYHDGELEVATDQVFKLDTPRHKRCLVEAVVSRSNPLVGRSIKDGRFRSRYNAVVIAVGRNGERLTSSLGEVVLQPGDILLVESHAGFLTRQRESRDFYLVSQLDNSSPLRREKAPVAFAILIGMVLAVATGWLPLVQAAMTAAGLMVVTGCCSFVQARRNIEWNVLLTISAALALGTALETTGAAGVLADTVLSLTGGRPWLTLAAVYLMTSLFTELVTNNAAAALVFPIAMQTSDHLGVPVMPFVMCIMIAASASFATPIGYQTNLMVYGPGGYRFSDYLKFGLPLNLLIGTVAVGIAPLLWPF